VTEGRAVPPPGKWQSATVVQVRRETATAKTFRLELAEPADYLPGQHYVLRLTAPDGYTASRSYSVASAPDGSHAIELTVERLAEGEVSSFLHDEVVVGDELTGRVGRILPASSCRPAVLRTCTTPTSWRAWRRRSSIPAGIHKGGRGRPGGSRRPICRRQ
jgi:NAD(P)H-flavin reductase